MFKTRWKLHDTEKKRINCSTCRNFTWPSSPSTGFKLTYRDSGNMNHLWIFTIQFFPPRQNITIPKYKKVSYSKTEKKTFLSAAVKTISRLFGEKCHFLNNAFQSYYDIFQVL